MEAVIKSRRSFTAWFVQKRDARLNIGLFLAILLIIVSFYCIFHWSVLPFDQETTTIHDIYFRPGIKTFMGVTQSFLKDVGLEASFDQYRAESGSFTKEYLIVRASKADGGPLNLDYYGFPSGEYYGLHYAYTIGTVSTGWLLGYFVPKENGFDVRDGKLIVERRFSIDSLGVLLVYFGCGIALPAGIAALIVFVLFLWLKARYKQSLKP